jgi:hypothetical protein
MIFSLIPSKEVPTTVMELDGTGSLMFVDPEITRINGEEVEDGIAHMDPVKMPLGKTGRNGINEMHRDLKNQYMFQTAPSFA